MIRFDPVKEGRPDPVLANGLKFPLGHPMPVVVLIDQIAVPGEFDVVLPVEKIPTHNARTDMDIGMPIQEIGRENGVPVHMEGLGAGLLMPVAESFFTQGLGSLPFLAQSVDPVGAERDAVRLE